MGDYNDAFVRNNNNAVQARAKAQNRANVMQLKLIGQSHPTGLTANLLKLFEPRPPLDYKPPPEKRKCPPYTWMAQFVSNFAEPGDPEYAPPVQKAETPAQRRARIHKLRLDEGAKKAAEELEKYDPNNDPNISGDPYRTLFVARLNYETTESRIKREFEAYGPVKRIRLIMDKVTNKPRGYAFIEYMHTRDMKAAYKQADGKKLDNRRMLVDVERGRTVLNWRPRRLGGGLGTTRVGGKEDDKRYSGREQPQSGGPTQSVEPRIRDDRHGDRDWEKSRERGKDKEREQSRERPRDHDHREDRHHRDRDRNRDRDRERDRGHDRDRGRGRDHDRDRERDRPRERDRDYEVVDLKHNHGRSHDREYDYDWVESKHERDQMSEKEWKYDNMEPEDDPGWYEQPKHGHRHPEAEHDHGHYEYYKHHPGDQDRYDHPDHDNNQFYQMEDDYHYDRATSDARERERTRDLDLEYRRSKRSLSR